MVVVHLVKVVKEILVVEAAWVVLVVVAPVGEEVVVEVGQLLARSQPLKAGLELQQFSPLVETLEVVEPVGSRMEDTESFVEAETKKEDSIIHQFYLTHFILNVLFCYTY